MGDLTTIHIWGTICLNQALNVSSQLDRNKHELPLDHFTTSDILINNLGSDIGVSAMSISDMENSDDALSLTSSNDEASRLWWSFKGMVWSSYIGLCLLWIAAGLTLITGLDYFVKALPFLRDEK